MKPEDRWGNGKCYTRPNNGRIYRFGRAIIKYGWDNFLHEVIYTELTKEQAVNKEKELISKHRTFEFEFGYNSDLGGTTKVHSIETKKKISSSMKKSTCWKDSEWRKKTFNAEFCLKVSKGVKKYFDNNENARKILSINAKKFVTTQFIYCANMAIKCLNDNKIFCSQSEASRFYKIPVRYISFYINGNRSKTVREKILNLRFEKI